MVIQSKIKAKNTTSKQNYDWIHPSNHKLQGIREPPTRIQPSNEGNKPWNPPPWALLSDRGRHPDDGSRRHCYNKRWGADDTAITNDRSRRHCYNKRRREQSELLQQTREQHHLHTPKVFTQDHRSELEIMQSELLKQTHMEQNQLLKQMDSAE